MLYALLIHHAEEVWDRTEPAERERFFAAHRQLRADTTANRTFRAAVQLMPSATATTVRRGGAAEAIVDGPFIESKELLAGLYLLECASLEEALEYARRIPTSAGGVEVRPVAFIGLEPE